MSGKCGVASAIMMAVVGVLVTGCATYYRVPPALSSTGLPTGSDGRGATMMDKKGERIDVESQAFRAAWMAAHSDIAQRNALIARMMVVSDDICLTHKAQIQSTSNSMNMSFGSLTSLFSGAASVVTPGNLSQALSAGATAANSTRSLINSEVYQQTLSITILNAIDALRAPYRTSIKNSLSKSVQEYPIEIAISDVGQYHESCSFIAGLSLVAKSVQQRQASKATILERLNDLRDQVAKNSALLTSDAELNAPIVANTAEVMKQIAALQLQLATAPE